MKLCIKKKLDNEITTSCLKMSILNLIKQTNRMKMRQSKYLIKNVCFPPLLPLVPHLWGTKDWSCIAWQFKNNVTGYCLVISAVTTLRQLPRINLQIQLTLTGVKSVVCYPNLIWHSTIRWQNVYVQQSLFTVLLALLWWKDDTDCWNNCMWGTPFRGLGAKRYHLVFGHFSAAFPLELSKWPT